MMGFEQRLAQISRRRVELVARSEAQRAELGDIGRAWHLPMAIIDQGVTIWRFFCSHPALVAGLGVAFAVARPRRAIKWFGRGWSLWRFFRGMAAKLGKPNGLK